jgi:hypothetical protein
MGMALALVLVAAASGTDTLVVVMMDIRFGQVPIGVGIHPRQAPQHDATLSNYSTGM